LCEGDLYELVRRLNFSHCAVSRAEVLENEILEESGRSLLIIVKYQEIVKIEICRYVCAKF